MKTKLTLFIVALIITSLVLAGCSSQTITTVSASSGLSTATRLAVGTLKLQGTSNAITSTQAAQLLTLWEAYQTMSSSDTASSVELEALVKQIESNLTSAQLEAIDDLSLTEESVNEIVQSNVATMPASQLQGTPSASSSTSMAVSASGISGGPSGSTSGAPAGSPPDGMQGAPASNGGGDSVMSAINGSGTTGQSTQATTQAVNNTAVSNVSPMLLQAVIQMLKSVSQVSG